MPSTGHPLQIEEFAPRRASTRNGAAVAAIGAPAVTRLTPPFSARPTATAAAAAEAQGAATALRLIAGRDDVDEVLDRREFIALARLEKRRADRSGAPLSLAVFEFGAPARELDRTLSLLIAVKRETDVVAQLDEAAAAVLLPDTDAAGLARFVHKAQSCGANAARIDSATYPDPRFDELVGERSVAPGGGEPRGSRAAGTAPQGYRLKRGFDVVAAATALLALSPLMLAAALAVRLSSAGPIVFRQTRIGQGGVPFVFYKFRSMTTGADDHIHREFAARFVQGAPPAPDGVNGTASYKMTSDPRITRVGRLLRKTSIDELPQFFNVLKGDMSLVGPRPPLPYEVSNYRSWHRRRLFELKPGLTGIWQVEGRSRVSFDEMVRMDLRYLKHCSLGFDLLTLLRTVKVVLRCDGAE